MIRSRRLRAAAVAAIVAALAVMTAGGQDERRVRIVPERPTAGAEFVAEAFLPDERAESLTPIEPALQGPASYAGADVRPAPGGGSIIVYRFKAEGAGRIDIGPLSARSTGRVLHLGSWSIEALESPRAPIRRYGSWRAPASVSVREAFVVTALGPDGEPAPCPGFALRGALLERVQGSPGSFRAVILEPGSVALPALELGPEGGRFSLVSSAVRARPLPDGAAIARAVGGSWRLFLDAPAGSRTTGQDAAAAVSRAVRVGDVVAWELRAEGSGWPGLASPPTLEIEAPSGAALPSAEGFMYTELARGSPAYVSGLRGAFSAAETGVYTLRPAPYPWYDPETGTLRLATASAVRIHVTDAAEREWIVPGAAADFALTVLGRLAVSSPEWAAAASAAESGDWGSALALAKAAAGIPASDLAIPTVAGREGSGASAAIASLVLLSPPGSSPPTSAAVGRAEAYAAFLRLERAGFPPPGVAEMAEITASSFGNLSKASYVLPPFGWLAFGSACAAALAVLLAVLGVARARAADRASVGRGPGPGPGRGEQARRFRSRSSKAAIAVALVAGACLALAAASYYERSGPRFVSLGGTGRSVPSELAAATVPVEPGATGSILQAAGPWLFVELDAGGTTWLAASDAARY